MKIVEQSPTLHSARHAAEAELLALALAGNGQAAKSVLQYLSSANPYLRQIMLETLQDRLDAEAWLRMLHCFTNHRWGDLEDSARWSDPVSARRIDQAIIQGFTRDENERDAAAKRSALETGLAANGELRFAAAYLLGLRGDKRVFDVLTLAVEQGGKRWQLCAVQALGALQDERCGFPLVRALAKDRDLIHREARRALSELGLLAEPALLEALNHPDAHIRWHAARALGEVGDDRAITLLAEGLVDENRSVRWASAEALAHLDLAAVPTILALLSRHKLDVQQREAIAHALRSMPLRSTRDMLHPLLMALDSASAGYDAPSLAAQLMNRLANRP